MRKGVAAANGAAAGLAFDSAPSRKEWDEFVSAAGGQVLQSWAWGEFKARTGWQTSRVVCRRDGRPVAAAQWLRRRAPVLGALAYVPRGPALARGESALVAPLLWHVSLAARRAGAFGLWLEPPWEQGSGPELPPEFAPAPQYIQPQATGLIDLRPPRDAVLSGFHGSMRRNIRLAARRGLKVREGSGEADWRMFYALLTETAARDNFGIHTWPYFAAMRETLEADGVTKLFLAEHGGEPVGGLLLTVYGGVATYLFGASATRGRDLRIGHGLQWRAMCWAKERGCHTYDLWGMPAAAGADAPLAGVYRFKHGFSPQVVNYAPTAVATLDARRFWVWQRLAPLARKLLPGL